MSTSFLRQPLHHAIAASSALELNQASAVRSRRLTAELWHDLCEIRKDIFRGPLYVKMRQAADHQLQNIKTGQRETKDCELFDIAGHMKQLNLSRLYPWVSFESMKW
jgi:hypothetical protein